MAAFETPAEAARAYGLAPEAVLRELHLAIAGRTPLHRTSSRGPKGRRREART